MTSSHGRNQITNLQLLHTFLNAMFNPLEGYHVVHVDISDPKLGLNSLARLCSRSDVVALQGGISTVCTLFTPPATPIIQLDDCMLQWGNIELGASLHNMVRKAGASDHRTALLRNGYFPPGEPRVDVYTVRALGDTIVPVVTLKNVIQQALEDGLSGSSGSYDSCMLQSSGLDSLHKAMMWRNIDKLGYGWFGEVGPLELQAIDEATFNFLRYDRA